MAPSDDGTTVGCSAGTPPSLGTVSSTPVAAATPLPETATASLLGTAPGEWQAERWLSSPPLRLADLRGKVVLARWWPVGGF